MGLAIECRDHEKHFGFIQLSARTGARERCARSAQRGRDSCDMESYIAAQPGDRRLVRTRRECGCAGSGCDLEGNCRLCEIRGNEAIFAGCARGEISRWRWHADGLRPGAERIHIYAGVCAGRETIEDRFPFKTCGWKDRVARGSADGYIESGCVSEGIERGWRSADH